MVRDVILYDMLLDCVYTALYSVFYIVYCVFCILYSVFYILYSVLCAVCLCVLEFLNFSMLECGNCDGFLRHSPSIPHRAVVVVHASIARAR
jgi:hypothetical protein